MTVEDFTHNFTHYAATKLAHHHAQIRRCTALLTLEDFWYHANEHTNSVANLLLHLRGNVRQWIVAGLGGESFERNRPAEFGARGPSPAEPICTAFDHTVDRALKIIRMRTPADLAHTYPIQGYDVSGLTAIFHVVEHFATHTGQIVHITKTLRNVDLSLYDAQGHKRDLDDQSP